MHLSSDHPSQNPSQNPAHTRSRRRSPIPARLLRARHPRVPRARAARPGASRLRIAAVSDRLPARTPRTADPESRVDGRFRIPPRDLLRGARPRRAPSPHARRRAPTRARSSLPRRRLPTTHAHRAHLPRRSRRVPSRALHHVRGLGRKRASRSSANGEIACRSQATPASTSRPRALPRRIR